MAHPARNTRQNPRKGCRIDRKQGAPQAVLPRSRSGANRRIFTIACSAFIVLVAGAAIVCGPRSRVPSQNGGLSLERCSTSDLANLSDEKLGSIDPVLVNLIVASEIPGLEQLDVNKYTAQVDRWAEMIKAEQASAEPHERDSATYRHDPDLWRAGGMAIALAGSRIGLKYTSVPLNPGKPEQSFAHGVIDLRTGTCANMPVLYLGIAHRLGWPLKAVVSGDHMWVRWDDGKKRFNLEATNAGVSGQVGSFSSLTDDELAQELNTPHSRIASGSDFTSLTPRQTLAIYLQSRAGYWATQGNLANANSDISLAHHLFSANYDIAEFLSRTEAGTTRRTPPLTNTRSVRSTRPQLTDAQLHILNSTYFSSSQTIGDVLPQQSPSVP